MIEAIKGKKHKKYNIVNKMKLYFSIFPIYSFSNAYLFLFSALAFIPGLPYVLFGNLLNNDGLNLGMVLIGLAVFAIIITTFYKPSVSAINLLKVVNKQESENILFSLDVYQKRLVMSLIITSIIYDKKIEEIADIFNKKINWLHKLLEFVKNSNISLKAILGIMSLYLFGEKMDIYNFIVLIISSVKELFSSGNAIYTIIILLIFIVLIIALYIAIDCIIASSWNKRVEEALKYHSSHRKDEKDFNDEIVKEKYNIIIHNI